MPTLIVPGVRVEARFDVLPPLPAAAGILGAVGIVDRPTPDGALLGVTNVTELRELLGPGTQASMPEVVHALANGVSEAVVAPVLGGAPASVPLENADGDDAVVLRCRSNGEWGDQLRVDVRGIADADGNIVRVTLRILRGTSVLETFSDLRVAPGEADDLVDTVNRLSRLVVAVDPNFEDVLPAEGTHPFNDDGDPIEVREAGPATSARVLMRLQVAPGADPDGLAVELETVDGNPDTVTVRVFQGGLQEEHTGLVVDPDSDRYLPYALLRSSRLVRVEPLSSLDEDKRLPMAIDVPRPFAGGESPTVDDYRTAIDRLADEPRVDLVLAAVEDTRPDAEARTIHQALVAHAQAMSDNGAPRIAFGSVTPDEQASVNSIKDHAATVRNRRFVLVSPAGAAGAVAGVVGRMNPQDSPTFKPVPLHGVPPARYRESELNKLLGPAVNALVVQDRAGRGIVALKGIDTTGDQISVTRVADQCIRETKAISENFIGRLNSEDARIALREQIVATFTRMERDGPLVPSTDGSDPAFVVAVYSTQQDFAQGIVRVEIAVRPVRAIDYVYAVIRVKN